MKRPGALAAAALLLLMAETTPPLPPDRETLHVVKEGETIGGIAQRAKVPRVLIIEANRLKAPFAVRAGQHLAIPRTRRHTVEGGDTRFTIAYLYGVPWADIAVANGIEPGAAIKPGQKLLIPTVIEKPEAPAAPASPAASPNPVAAAPAAARFAWPVSGSIRRGFAARGQTGNYHDGIDLTANEGTAVRAAEAGKVLFAGTEPRQFGNLVVIDHGDGWQTAYAFLSRITVKEGDRVGKGERVGLSGHTGKARGSELHFEMRRNNKPVDPETALPARDQASAQNTAPIAR